ncbi:MAG: cytochrome c maturation protein CcmE [Spirochaetes bacterium]|nr:MAG: cytochrome c maturation protein CcmE [Spirochaetota bacterium]
MRKKLILFGLVALFIAIAAFSMRGMLTPYVAFREAMETGSFVQVIGALEKNVPVERTRDGFSFTLRDNDGTLMRVTAAGPEPANLTHADKVVALGTYSTASALFVADKILVKCPSKYTKEKKK